MRPLLIAALALASSAPAASAQDPATPPATTTPEQTQPVAPAKATLRIALERVNGKDRAVISGSRVRVRGAVSRYVPGQTVTVRWYRAGRKLGSRKVAIQRAGSSPAGTFVTGFLAAGDGRITVRASHRRTAELDTIVSGSAGVRVLARRAAAGDRGIVVRLLQRQLRQRGYVVGTAGYMDARTIRAVGAFRKLAGMRRTQEADGAVFGRLAAGAGYFKVRYPGHGKHVEADLTHQVLALIRGRKVERIYPISSGAPVTPTILGSFRVYSKTPGTNQKGMVFSSYFIRGYAIHGYASVPPYPASHGCLRVPVPDAVPIYNWLSYGDGVDTYYR
ncbi:MAG: L,D-transpeptidase [Baekduia sp.]